MANEPVTDVDPVSDSPRSRVEMFKSSSFEPASIDRQAGYELSSTKTDHITAFSIDSEGKPTESATLAVHHPKTVTTWHPHHLDGPQLISGTDSVVPGGFGTMRRADSWTFTPTGSIRNLTGYELRLMRDPKAQKDGTAPLFYVDEIDAKVDDSYRSEGGINLVGRYLLGAVGKQFSGINMPSYAEALSPWSASLVRRAGKLNLVKENPRLPFSEVDKIAKTLNYSDSKQFNDAMSSSINRDYSSAKNYSGSTQIPEEEVREFPKVVRSALADAKSQQFSEALNLPKEEDNTRDVPLPGFEEK